MIDGNNAGIGALNQKQQRLSEAYDYKVKSIIQLEADVADAKTELLEIRQSLDDIEEVLAKLAT